MGEKEKILKEAGRAASHEEVEAALAALSELIEKMPGHEDLFYARAELYYKLNRYGQAINDYMRVLSINPDNKEAAGKIDILKTILRFHNTDIYANPNTDMDPWLE